MNHDYILCKLQNGVLATRSRVVILEESVPDFDYAEFAEHATKCKMVNDSKEMRSAIAHILWITDDRFIK